MFAVVNRCQIYYNCKHFLSINWIVSNGLKRLRMEVLKWQSSYPSIMTVLSLAYQATKHSVASSSWKGGKGYVVLELRVACSKYGIKFGVYLSSWDRKVLCYGDSPACNKYPIPYYECLGKSIKANYIKLVPLREIYSKNKTSVGEIGILL